MRITEVRHVSVPLRGQIANAVVDFSRHTVSLVALVSDVIRDGRPVTGVAFNSIGRFAQDGIIRDRLAPRLLDAPPDALFDDGGRISPALVSHVLMRDEKPGGHGDRASAIGAIELAAWDLRAKIADEPAYNTIATAFGRDVSRHVHVYAAGGYYREGDAVASIDAEIAAYIDMGFSSFKIKIGGAALATDLARIDAAIARAGSGTRVAVDANGRYDIDDAIRLGSILAPYGLRWYEEPGDPLDYRLMRDLADVYDGALATGENLFSLRDVDNLLRYSGMRPASDIFQMDAGLSYGLTEYAAMIAAIEHAGFSRTAAMPHGGHLLNLHIVAGLNLGGCEAYPSVFQPFGGYLPDLVVEDGIIGLPDTPGFGLEAKPELRPHIEALLD